MLQSQPALRSFDDNASYEVSYEKTEAGEVGHFLLTTPNRAKYRWFTCGAKCFDKANF
jgi:hypothetical protein